MLSQRFYAFITGSGVGEPEKLVVRDLFQRLLQTHTGRRLIGDDELRIADQCRGNQHAPRHTAGKLQRIKLFCLLGETETSENTAALFGSVSSNENGTICHITMFLVSCDFNLGSTHNISILGRHCSLQFSLHSKQ